MDWKTVVSFKPRGLPESEVSILKLESLIGVRLPADYRHFLATEGGGYLETAYAECSGLTPFGSLNITKLHTASEVVRLLHSAITPRNMVCVGGGHFGMTTCLSVAGLDHGQVFALDTEMRYFNWDEEALSRLPDLLESIKHFFELRDSGELPERPWGYENCYHVADCFAAFLDKLTCDSPE